MDQGASDFAFCGTRRAGGKHHSSNSRSTTYLLANLPVSSISQHNPHVSREILPSCAFSSPICTPPPSCTPPGMSLSKQWSANSLCPVCVCTTRQPGRGRRQHGPAEEDARETVFIGGIHRGGCHFETIQGQRGSAAGFPREWEMFRNGLPPGRAQSHAAAGRAVGPLFVVDEPPSRNEPPPPQSRRQQAVIPPFAFSLARRKRGRQMPLA